jgi:hypothetical protein
MPGTRPGMTIWCCAKRSMAQPIPFPGRPCVWAAMMGGGPTLTSLRGYQRDGDAGLSSPGARALGRPGTLGRESWRAGKGRGERTRSLPALAWFERGSGRWELSGAMARGRIAVGGDTAIPRTTALLQQSSLLPPKFNHYWLSLPVDWGCVPPPSVEARWVHTR